MSYIVLAILLNLTPFLYFKSVESGLLNSSSNQIIPIGISYFTLQILALQIDLFRSKKTIAFKLADYFNYIYFFPVLIAGPINRISLLEQMQKNKIGDTQKFYRGIFYICMGLVKKFILASLIYDAVGPVLLNPMGKSVFLILFSIIILPFQFYYDFSSFSDLAYGGALCFGYDVPLNFNRPFYSENMIMFWQKWHISLSTWVRDYIFFPLGVSRLGIFSNFLTILISFILIGLWHGFNWALVVYGFAHGTIIYILSTMIKPLTINRWIKILFNYIFFISLTFLLLKYQNFNDIYLLFKSLFWAFKFFGKTDFGILVVLLTILLFEIFDYYFIKINIVEQCYKKGYLFNLFIFVAFTFFFLKFGKFERNLNFIFPGY